MTQVGSSAQKMSKAPSINRDLDNLKKNQMATESRGGGSKESKVSQVTTSSNEEKYIDINLEDPYEDDDFKIYFDKASLMAHLNHLEDDNLFKIHLVQEEGS